MSVEGRNGAPEGEEDVGSDAVAAVVKEEEG